MSKKKAARLGAGRNARYVLAGSVQRLGSTHTLAADIMDIELGALIEGIEVSYTDFAQGIERVSELAAQLNSGG